MTNAPPPTTDEDRAVFASAGETLDALAAVAARAARAAAAIKTLEAMESLAARATVVMQTLGALESLAAREARRAMADPVGDAVVADAREQPDEILRAFIALLAAGYDRLPAVMMALAVLSPLPQARERGRAWCVKHLSTRDDPTGTAAAVNLGFGTAETLP